MRGSKWNKAKSLLLREWSGRESPYCSLCYSVGVVNHMLLEMLENCWYLKEVLPNQRRGFVCFSLSFETDQILQLPALKLKWHAMSSRCFTVYECKIPVQLLYITMRSTVKEKKNLDYLKNKT